MSKYRVLWHPIVPEGLWTGVERCFILTGQRYGYYLSIASMIEVQNIASNPVDDFAISSRDVEIVSNDLLDSPEKIVGFAHTHPDELPEPSGNDIAGLKKGYLGVVLCGGNLYWYSHIRAVDVQYL